MYLTALIDYSILHVTNVSSSIFWVNELIEQNFNLIITFSD